MSRRLVSLVNVTPVTSKCDPSQRGRSCSRVPQTVAILAGGLAGISVTETNPQLDSAPKLTAIADET